jgi:UDP-N-acetylglucosamine:LPS N-acetylglucosamine transferase
MAKRILVVSARMGAGHDGAAREICKKLDTYGYETKVVDFLDASPIAGRILYDTYHFQMERSPWSYSAMYWAWSKFNVLTRVTTLIFGLLFERRLRQWATDYQADAIVSTYPFASVVLGRARRKRFNPLRIPAITFLTDFAVHPLWVHDGIDEHVCVSPSAASGVRHLLQSPKLSISGPFVNEEFFTIRDKPVLRRELELPDDETVVILSAGSWGVGDIESTYRSLTKEPGIFPILICGRNEILFQRIQSLPGGRAIGWTDRMVDYLSAADVVVQNAGGLTALEAFATGTPVVSYKPIAGHGRDNTKRMQLSGVTLYARHHADLLAAIHQAVERRELLTTNALSLFDPAPERHILAAIESATPVPVSPDLPLRPKRVLSRIAVGALMLLVASNLTADVIGARGLNVASASVQLPYVYLAVLPSTAALNSPAVERSLAANDISTIVPLSLAKLDPNGIRRLYRDGITLINGGSTDDAALHLLLPINAAAQTYAALQNITGHVLPVYLPQEHLNGVDLAWAALHHQVVPRLHIFTSSSKTKIAPGSKVYELDGVKMSPQQLLQQINILLHRVHSLGDVVASVSTLS